jgi:hypothetical protein
VRQRSQLERHPERGKFDFDEIAPAPRSPQAFLKAIGQALLKAYAFGRGAEGVVTDVFRPQGQYARLFLAQVFALAGGKALQYANERISTFLDPPVALLAADAGGYIDALVDHREIAIVVQYPLIATVVREYGYPEIDVWLQFFGERKGLLPMGRQHRKAQIQQRKG